MYQIVIIIQCISIAAVFAECWVVLKNWKNKMHSYLFFSCSATLINGVGYLLELTAKTEEGYWIALKASWLGRAWITFSLFIFIVELCKVYVPLSIRIFLGMINVVTYALVLTTDHTGLFYRDTSFSMYGDFPIFQYRNGVWHYFWGVMLIIYITAGICMLIVAARREKNPVGKKRIRTVILAVLTDSLFVLIEMFGISPLSGVYDVTMLGFPIAAIFMFIAIFRYNLLDVESIAKEYAIEELSSGVVAVNDKGKVDYYNRTAAAIFPELETNGRRVVEDLCSSIETGDLIRVNKRIYTPEEKPVIQGGVNVGTVYTLTDSTSHYRHIRELEEQKQIANDANKAKSSFLANMSHEIRTPINSVLGMDEMILRESREKETLAYAEDIRSAGRTLLSLINDILDFSKIEEGKMEILPTKYELSSVVSDLVNMVKDKAEKKGLILEANIDPRIPHSLYGDEIRIKQVILNLLTNSVKYTKQGHVILDMWYSKLDEDHITLSCRVGDTGIGMRKEDLDRLFVPFERIDELRNRSIEGTGLGMSIVQQLLALMDSRLDVKSVYGEGTEISFDIKQKVLDWEPMGDISERIRKEANKRGKYRELFHAPNARILVIDDNEVNLTVIKKLLKKTGMQIDTAQSGQNGLVMMGKNRYDIVFIDHMMPYMDGIETLHRAVEENLNREAVFIALTANAISGAREMYLSEGFSDYISKPVDSRELEEMICRYLPEEKVENTAETQEEQNSEGVSDREQGNGQSGGVSAETTSRGIGNGETKPLDKPGYEEKPEREADREYEDEIEHIDKPGYEDDFYEDDEGSMEVPESHIWLYDVEELDVEKGIGLCGSFEDFLVVLGVYHSVAGESADDIERYCESGDLENYTIKVHALKSSSKSVGADGISEMARELEEAGKAGDLDRIRSDTGKLLKRFREFNRTLSRLDQEL